MLKDLSKLLQVIYLQQYWTHDLKLLEKLCMRWTKCGIWPRSVETLRWSVALSSELWNSCEVEQRGMNPPTRVTGLMRKF